VEFAVTNYGTRGGAAFATCLWSVPLCLLATLAAGLLGWGALNLFESSSEGGGCIVALLGIGSLAVAGYSGYRAVGAVAAIFW